MLRYVFPLLIILLVRVVGASQSPSRAPALEKQQIATSLVPDKTSIMLGEPIYLSLIVQNNSSEDLQVLVGGDYRNRLGRPESFTVSVTGEGGKLVAQPDVGQTFGGLTGGEKLEAGASYTFKLLLPHWATFEEVGHYTILTRRTLKLRKYTADRWNFKEKATEIEAQASASIEVVPRDSGRMMELIAVLGTAMLSGRYPEAQEATRTLSCIHDERVIPFFVSALETNSYELKFQALAALSGYKDEAAFQALKQGMETRGEDIGDTANPENANQSAANIRHAAAVALAKSPHPGAISFLLIKRNDTSEGVRSTILHVLGKMTPEVAIPILQEMTHDQSKLVRDEAKRYLDLLTSQKNE